MPDTSGRSLSRSTTEEAVPDEAVRRIWGDDAVSCAEGHEGRTVWHRREYHEPPDGWVAMGTHAGADYCAYTGPLEFSEAHEEDGLPRWERHDGCTAPGRTPSPDPLPPHRPWRWDAASAVICERDKQPCICPHEEGSLGRLDGISMRVQAHEVPVTNMKRYYLTGYVCIDAESDEQAQQKFEQAGLGVNVEVAEGVTLDFQGEWDQVENVAACICPPDLVARGGFRSECSVHA